MKKLAAAGITNVEQMLEAGKTQSSRQKLSVKTSIPPGAILELVNLSDLARIPGVKSIRARLYYNAEVKTIEKLEDCDPEVLRVMLTEYIEHIGFKGVAPLPKEVRYTVSIAKKLPNIVEY